MKHRSNRRQIIENGTDKGVHFLAIELCGTVRSIPTRWTGVEHGVRSQELQHPE